jgi:carbonic anhydrase
MFLARQSDVTRRDLLQLGALSGLATVLLPSLLGESAKASQISCNDRPTDPTSAFNALLRGNSRWAKREQKHPGEGKEIRRCLANNSQTPFAAILACVDSRVPPELIFDRGLGDLFTARVAGNSVVPILEDSLRYGTENLGALVLLVLGHSDCGAVKAAVQFYLRNAEHFPFEADFPEASSGEFEGSLQAGFDWSIFPRPEFAFIPPILPAVRVARKIVKEEGGDPNDHAQVTPVAIDQHVILTAQKLSSRQPFKDLVNKNKLLVTGGRYDLNNQLVTMLLPS